MTLNDIDKQILNILQKEGRISVVELAERIKLSQTATHIRIKHLEQKGYIKQYVAILNHEKVGHDSFCFVSVNLDLQQQKQVSNFRRVIQEMPEVSECYHVTGKFDYILKIAVQNRKELERFLTEKLMKIPGVARIYTSIVLKDIKLTSQLPIL